MNVFDIILLIVLAASLVCALRLMHKRCRQGNACLGCGGNCTACCGCSPGEDRRK